MTDHYGTLAGALAYHADRGNVAWVSSSDPLRTAALVRATMFVDSYRSRFPGYKAARRAQTLEWPRFDAYDAAGEHIASDAVPIEIEHATYEAALRELASPGSLAPDLTPGVRRKKVKAGPVETETEYAGGGFNAAKSYSVIEGILSGLLGARSAFVGTAVRG